MVKLAFNSALGQKDLKKEEKDEALIPQDVVSFVSTNANRLLKFNTALITTLLLRMYFCGVNYREENYKMQDSPEETDMDMPAASKRIEERVRVLEDEGVELINIPVPKFSDSDPADIVHDFNRRLTAYLDLRLNKCYVIPLNTSSVSKPPEFLVFEHVTVNLWLCSQAGTYLPQSYLVREQMIVTGKLEHVDQLGYFIYGLCRGRDTYKLEHREAVFGKHMHPSVLLASVPLFFGYLHTNLYRQYLPVKGTLHYV
uniref:Integral membrane protein 2 n=1 Tax=Sinocyclocheilus grahami TaxID=75366 RepID=A0A672T1X9_SINGR